MKIAVCTTFPLNYPTFMEMLTSFDQYWPKDVDLYIALDKVSEVKFRQCQDEFNKIMPSGRQFFISNEWSQDKEAFFKRNADSPDVPYRFHVCKFSHKVFALSAMLGHDYDYLIWLDADVITTKPVELDGLLPKDDELVSYLGRTDAPHSECSFVAYNLKNGGGGIIDEMHQYYVTDKVLTLPGWTDCDVFDDIIKDKKTKNLSKDIKGWHVFPESPCGKYMVHHKGNRKFEQKKRHVVDANNMQIKTKNCLPHEKILKNIQTNTPLIKHWADYVKPHGESVVICSAGPSLNYCDIKPYADAGVKIVAVKHAIDRLKSWGIKPWACVLLDPRSHVEKFVQEPDKDVIYFVASMVDPSVVKALLDVGSTIVGYHAFVGAGEHKILTNGTLMVAGGSGTATRCIGLLHECYGFNNFECYGYDLCYYEKPDMSQLGDDGNPKYLEITLSTQTAGNKPATRTFWTEGQYLAQAKELHDLYKTENRFKLNLYGDGIGAWQQLHFKQYKAWLKDSDAKIDKRKSESLTLEEWEHGIRSATS